jgi:hypothetical protein
MNHLSGRGGNLHKLIKAEMMTTGYKLRLPLHGTSTQIWEFYPPPPSFLISTFPAAKQQVKTTSGVMASLVGSDPTLNTSVV